jgi:hypothetical protein
MPVATPCTTRAVSSTATFPATRNSSRATASRVTAAASTGRRPMWSESAPNTSSELSSPKTNIAKISVSVAAEKPHIRWYTTYNGAGALDAAWNSSRIAVTTAKPAGRGSRLGTGRAAGAAGITFESGIYPRILLTRLLLAGWFPPPASNGISQLPLGFSG